MENLINQPLYLILDYFNSLDAGLGVVNKRASFRYMKYSYIKMDFSLNFLTSNLI